MVLEALVTDQKQIKKRYCKKINVKTQDRWEWRCCYTFEILNMFLYMSPTPTSLLFTAMITFFNVEITCPLCCNLYFCNVGETYFFLTFEPWCYHSFFFFFLEEKIMDIFRIHAKVHQGYIWVLFGETISLLLISLLQYSIVLSLKGERKLLNAVL